MFSPKQPPAQSTEAAQSAHAMQQQQPQRHPHSPLPPPQQQPLPAAPTPAQDDEGLRPKKTKTRPRRVADGNRQRSARAKSVKAVCRVGGARTFSGSTPSAAASRHASSPEQGDAELRQRASNMERLLVHFVGNISLDAQTLQGLADSLDQERGGPGHGPAPALGTTGKTLERRRLSSRERREDGGGGGRGAHASREGDVETDSNASEYIKVDDDITVQPLENNVTRVDYSGEFSHWNFSMRIKNWIEKCGPYRTDAPDAPKIKEFYRAEELQSSSDTAVLLSALPPRYIVDFLVRAFFTYAETNYFYVDRTWLAKRLDAVYENPTSLTRRDVPTVCIMFTVFAIGTQYAYLDSPHDKTDDPSPFSEDSVGVKMYQQACRLVPDVITIASLESVQAILLIGLYTLPLDPSGLSYTYFNLAVKLAIQNGMHRKHPNNGLDQVVRETRNRVWWTACTIEKRIGTFHGRPISIAMSDIDAELPVDRPEIWPGPGPQNTIYLLATLHLNRELARIAHEISTFKTYDKQAIFTALARLVDIKDELQTWWRSLPSGPFCKDADRDPTAPVSRAAIHLRLEYCHVRMYAGRLFITPRGPLAVNASPGSSTATDAPGTAGSGSAAHRNSGPSRNAQRRAALVADCVDAALDIVDTCRLLRGTIGLARASYTEFSALRVGLLVLLTQCLEHRGANRTERCAPRLATACPCSRTCRRGARRPRFDGQLIEP
ncbi:PrnA protein [Verticillium alfalfae VaMs.102]|uniref:PrnA protein n=1 Tax=Verticillium alfalfae (strain VaMs.102 / ATCC MYA-4576 / FGSC 10136) TaxID=526221 RepID=C9SKY0_VERA1|nr:PrnA protein [Verticillium alfalfae VaMs.102]EEY19348.1 PrnA protein [Verticillium alfalfae VaMs.102]